MEILNNTSNKTEIFYCIFIHILQVKAVGRLLITFVEEKQVIKGFKILSAESS